MDSNYSYVVEPKCVQIVCMSMAQLRSDTARQVAHRNRMSESDFSLAMWRARILFGEMHMMGPGDKIAIVSWLIKSDKKSFFRVADRIYASDYVKVITPQRAYWRKQGPNRAVQGVKKFQREILSQDGKIFLRQDVQPFYHSLEKCAVLDSLCPKWLSCTSDFSELMNRDEFFNQMRINPPILRGGSRHPGRPFVRQMDEIDMEIDDREVDSPSPIFMDD